LLQALSLLLSFPRSASVLQTGPFPAARDVIFGTAFAISDEHVVQAAASVGDVALGQLTVPVGDSRYDVATDWEVFEGIDVAVTGHERGRRLSRNEGLRERFLRSSMRAPNHSASQFGGRE
jgi:hypothetical protein